MNERFLQILREKTEFYPYVLEDRFPRVFNKIVELCETKHLEAYLLDLMVDKRGGTRQGFPQDAATEIIRLGNYIRTLNTLPVPGRVESVWDTVPEFKQLEIERLGYKFSANGFLKAVDNDNKEAVHVFLSCGIDLEVKDERGWTALILAAANGNEKFTLLLIHCGSHLMSQDINGFTPLHWAAYSGMTNVAILLISKGADVNHQSRFGWTPLMQACTRGHLSVCSTLIDAGTKINLSSNEGTTALHIAAGKGFYEIAKLLVSKGANSQHKSTEGYTPLMLAVKYGHTRIAELLAETKEAVIID